MCAVVWWKRKYMFITLYVCVRLTPYHLPDYVSDTEGSIALSLIDWLRMRCAIVKFNRCCSPEIYYAFIQDRKGTGLLHRLKEISLPSSFFFYKIHIFNRVLFYFNFFNFYVYRFFRFVIMVGRTHCRSAQLTLYIIVSLSTIGLIKLHT